MDHKKMPFPWLLSRRTILPFILALQCASIQAEDLEMTVCRGKCEDDCKAYLTPAQICFDPKEMFGADDPTWSDCDVFDELLNSPNASGDLTFRRFIFATNDGSCDGDPVDVFIIPFQVCVGPFGQPRPWGKFELIPDDDMANLEEEERT